MRLAGKRCLIVGGTSGIGLAAVKQFLAEGADLVIVGHDQKQCDDLGFEIAGRGSWFVITGDASDESSVEHFYEIAIEQLGGLDVLYHVAGISGRKSGDGPLHECTGTGWQATIDANLKSVFLTNRAAVQQFLKQGSGGNILNMSSVLALAPSPKYFDTFAYTASKGGIIAMSRLAAARYASDRIRVNVLAPGLIDTPMSTRAVADPEIRAFLRAKQPLAGGPGKPEDLADAAVFLCSDEARFITGVVLPADGGWCVSEG